MTRVTNTLVVVKPKCGAAFVNRNNVIDFRFKLCVNHHLQSLYNIEVRLFFVIYVSSIEFILDIGFNERLPVVSANIALPVLTHHEKERSLFLLRVRPCVGGLWTKLVFTITLCVMFCFQIVATPDTSFGAIFANYPSDISNGNGTFLMRFCKFFYFRIF